MAKFIIDTGDNKVSRSMLELILEESLDYNISIKEITTLSEDRLNELATEMLRSGDPEFYEYYLRKDTSIDAILTCAEVCDLLIEAFKYGYNKK